MKYLIPLIIIFSFIFSCTTTGPDNPVPPKRLLMIERPDGADTLEFVRGISTLPDIENKIQIMWQKPGINENIKSFRIFRSFDKEGLINYNLFFTLSVNNPGNPDTIFIDSEVEIGTSYHYFITAVNNDNLESEPSDTVSFKLLDKAELLDPQNGNEINQRESITFHWYREETPPNYVIRIEEYYTDTFHPLVYVHKIFNTKYDPHQQYTISQEIADDILTNGRNYRWRIDSIEDPELPTGNPLVKIYAESQSEYFTFKIRWSTK